MSNTKIRYGFLSTANITSKMKDAVKQSDNGMLSALASREKSKAEQWLEELNMKNDIEALGDYDSLLEKSDIEVIYLPLPSGVKKSWVLQAIQKGKHVLCDKPFVSTEEVQEIIDAARKRGVVFMDNTMYVHNPRTKALCEIVKSGELGEVQHVQAAFTFVLPKEEENIRFHRNLEPHGSLGDIGWYPIRTTLMAYNFELPKKVQAYYSSHNDVIYSLVATLWFGESKTSSLYCGFNTTVDQSLRIHGTKKTLHIDDCYIPEQLANTGKIDKLKIYLTDEPGNIETKEFDLEHSEILVIQEFSRMVQRRKEGNPDTEAEDKWARQTLLTQVVVDALEKSAREKNVVDVNPPPSLKR